jgi:hypothetical protein
MASSSPISGSYDMPPNPAIRHVPITSTSVIVQPRRANGVPHPTNGTNSCMAPTWSGFIHSTMDALFVLEACLQGKLSHIPRRPHDRERANIITSGNVFIYEENASGIKRWTDGVTWSPSRIMGNFLVYRELNEPFPAGEKKKAKKRKRGAEETEPVENLNGQSGKSYPGSSCSNPVLNSRRGRSQARRLIGRFVWLQAERTDQKDVEHQISFRQPSHRLLL